MNVVANEIETEQVNCTSNGVKLVGQLFLPAESGPFPLLILCHGAGEFKEHYFELCTYLASRGIGAYALDMHGHGESEGERFHVNIKDWTQDVRAAIDTLSSHDRVDSDRIGAFGLSSGGTAILEASLVDPRLKALVLLDATVRNSMPLMNTLVVGALVWLGRLKKFFTGKDLRLPILKMFGDVKLVTDPKIEEELLADPRTTEAFMTFPFPGATETFFVNTLRRVDAISVPTLVVWGAEDQLDPPKTAEMIFQKLNCEKRLEIVDGNGHAGHLDRNRDKVFAVTTEWALGNLA